jgi:hypothetical protein
MRLLLVVENTPAVLDAICERQPGVRTLVANQWIQVVAVPPGSTEMFRWTPAGWQPVSVSTEPLPVVASSRAWYRGKRDFVPPALVLPEGWSDVR